MENNLTQFDSLLKRSVIIKGSDEKEIIELLKKKYKEDKGFIEYIEQSKKQYEGIMKKKSEDKEDSQDTEFLIVFKKDKYAKDFSEITGNKLAQLSDLENINTDSLQYLNDKKVKRKSKKTERVKKKSVNKKNNAKNVIILKKSKKNNVKKKKTKRTKSDNLVILKSKHEIEIKKKLNDTLIELKKKLSLLKDDKDNEKVKSIENKIKYLEDELSEYEEIKKLKEKLKKNKVKSDNISIKGSYSEIPIIESPKDLLIDTPNQFFKIGEKTKEIKKKKNEIAPISPEAWMLPDRMKFVEWINDTFKQYKITGSEDTEGDCNSMGSENDKVLFSHQQFVKDYMQAFSPYRGLLIFHGLGSGKTAASISIAEGSKTEKNIIVMLPASLEANYVGDLKKWGAKIYRTNQDWAFVKCTDKSKIFLNFIKNKGLSEKKGKEIIKNNKGGLWLTEEDSISNDILKNTKFEKYELLELPSQEQIFRQIDKLIEEKYTFLHYNGGSSFYGYLEKQIKEGYNDFDNKVIIIDEVHNVISMMIGNSKIGKKLHQLLMEAKNCRIVFLSGTPGINSPYELGVMLSILRGYIKSYKLDLRENKSWDKETDSQKVKNILQNIPGVDQVIIDPSRAILEITRNPKSFSNLWKKNKYIGVHYHNNDMDDRDFLDIIEKELEKNKYKVTKGNREKYENKLKTVKKEKKDLKNQLESDAVSEEKLEELTNEINEKDKIIKALIYDKENEINKNITNYTALPVTENEFNDFFIDLENLEVKNKELFKKRIMGLISYYKGIGDNVFPDVIKGNYGYGEGIVKVPMSDYQFKQYESVRQIEREKESKKMLKKDKGKEKKDIKKEHQQALKTNTSYYRTFSRQRCNFVFPPEIERPMTVFINEQLKKNNIDDEKNDQENVQVKLKLNEAIEKLSDNKNDFLSKGNLEKYSPKFLTILENIEKSPGLALVYSCFKTCEGLGVFALVLEANGYARYKVSINKDKEVTLDIKPGDEDKPKYMIYSGNEDEYERRILRDVFNSSENMRGEKIKVFLTSPSGAEGISLSNVRQVHIMEPFWHNVRLEQVMGRAVRICSHKNLPLKDRNVEIFVYISKFTEEQIKRTATIMIQDNAKSSDEYIYDLAERKKKIMNELFKMMKEASVDCGINHKAHINEYVKEQGPKGQIKCMHFGSNIDTDNYSFIPDIYNETQDKYKKQVQRENKVKAIKIQHNNETYMLGIDGHTLYDYKSWDSVPPIPVIVGKVYDGNICLFFGTNIKSVKDINGKIYFFNQLTKEIYNETEYLMKLTTIKSKGPSGKKKIEFYYNKETDLVYSKLDLISENNLIEVGKIVNESGKRKVKFLENDN